MTKQAVWLVDVDGTVALRKESGRGPFEWERVGEDEPNEPILIAVRALLAADHHVLFVSGRNEVCFTATWQWLGENVERGYVANALMQNVEGLLMRPNTPEWMFQPDYLLKEWLYETFIQPQYDVIGILDDRKQVVNMWRTRGLCCLQVAEGDF